MEDELPSEYDAIILGTGLPESVTAAALARVGFKVLHLDRNDYYSGQWTTFTFDSLLSWIESHQTETPASSETPAPSETQESSDCASSIDYLVPIPARPTVIHNVVTALYFSDEKKEDSCQQREGKKADSTTSVASDVCYVKKLDTEGQQEKATEVIGSNEPGDKSNEKIKECLICEGSVTSQAEGVEPNSETKNVGTDQCKSDETICSTTSGKQGQERLQTYDLNKESVINKTDQELPPVTTEAEATQQARTEEQPTADVLPAANEIENDVNAVVDEPSSNIFRSHVRHARPPISTNMTFDDLKPYFRRFNIDLAPKLLFSRGPLVEALISANISHYAEFKAVNRILTYLKKRIEEVPCSRADVFSSKLISVIEKRMLMKFLTFCVEFEQHPEEYEAFQNKAFLEFLKSRRFTPSLQHFALHAIAMATSATSSLDGLKATQSFLKSLGRYGNTPFIWPLYGSGEMPQAFCRMCAVFGGLYCLRKSASSLIIHKETKQCTGIVLDGQNLKAKWIIMEYSYVPANCRISVTKTSVSRAVFITDKSLKPGEEEYITLLTVPQAENAPLIRVIELGPSTMACPQGLYVVHFICEGRLSAQEDLEDVARQLFFIPTQPGDFSGSDKKPAVLWSLYFNQLAPDVSACTTGLPDNVMVTSLPGADLGFGEAIEEAKGIFKKICPDEEFLPAVPNPEDILWDEMLPFAEENEAGFGSENRSDVDEASGDTNREPGTSEASEDMTVGPGTSGSSDYATEEPEASGALEATPGPGVTGASDYATEEPGASGALEATPGPGVTGASDYATEEPGASGALEATPGPGVTGASRDATEEPGASGALEDTPGPGVTGASRDAAEEPGTVESSEDATDGSNANSALGDAVDGAGTIEA